MSAVRVIGKVKLWVEERGFGFIRPDNGGEEIFVHRSDLNHSIDVLLVDQKVSFELVDNPRKPGSKKAAGVQLL